MATLNPSYRRDTVLLPTSSTPSATPRRATVSSPAPSFAYSNTFESYRPRSRTDRYTLERPYPNRRSTISGNSEGHNVNNAPQLVRVLSLSLSC